MNKDHNAEIKYDYETDIFSVYPIKRKYDSSFQINDFIFDIDKKGKINGIEILNASKVFNIDKLALKNMVSVELELIVNEEAIHFKIFVKSKIRNAQKTSMLNIEKIKPEFLQPTELNLAVA